MDSKGLHLDEANLTITDDLPSRHGLLRFLFSLNLLIAIMKLIDGVINGFSPLDYIVIIATGIPATIFFVYFWRKETAQSTIKIEDILELKERKQLFQKQYILELANGKNRELPGIQTHQQFQDLKEAIKKAKSTSNDSLTASAKSSVEV